MATPTLYDHNHNAFQVEWRQKYIAALEKRSEILVRAIEYYKAAVGSAETLTPRAQAIVENKNSSHIIEFALLESKYEIELLELHHKITHEKIVLADWLKRSSEHNTFEAQRQEEAAKNIDKVVECTKSTISALKQSVMEQAIAEMPEGNREAMKKSVNTRISRLETLLSKYHTCNLNDAGEKEKIYSSMKVALEQMGIKWNE